MTFVMNGIQRVKCRFVNISIQPMDREKSASRFGKHAALAHPDQRVIGA
jgi:hypothetical protein